ncbi:MAG: type II toxin-antitoxin system HicB family antitoxin [Ignavibacteria bacterium]|nr:type II toxin-antitoxin system HicB family antitoxin [Ignavibacteria bacterium]
MRQVIQISIYKGEKFIVAEGVNVPIVTQGKTYDELFNNLKEAISLFLEDEDLSKYDIQANPAIIANLELNNILYA